MPELQRRFTSVLERVLSGLATVETEVAPDWLRRPGRDELGNAWMLAQHVYGQLTGNILPDVMPPRERRRVDLVLTYADGSRQIVEFDERQHFTAARLTTLEVYDDSLPVGFDVSAWRDRCIRLQGREAGGGFAAPKPPLFPDAGGRHRQRAFRDFLADVLPPRYGWRPTVRFQDVEVAALLSQNNADEAISALWRQKPTFRI
ncbi:hypothetical protein [Cryobacterium sp. BB307]|uniref:hypothetical protein n=1 Tax=Cryobacterium sp. BB307 TaxID=2716317 RepID=UPI001446A980|nr:hypothetical protein [Cryobacterium sp. BB307]